MALRLAARDAQVVYRAADGSPLPALGPATFEIDARQFVALIGPSGCGKSTLLRLFAGLQAPTRGDVYLGEQKIIEPSRPVAVMFQDANLMPWRTVIDNVALPLELAGTSKSTRYAQTRPLLTSLNLADFERAYPGELSGGMAQRVALGRVLVQQPEVLLLDEPFGALDALTRERVSADLMRMWSAEQQTVLMVTHDIREAVWLSDRVLVMSHRPGRILADVTVDLPRPRPLEMTYTPAFNNYAAEVRGAIEIA